MVWYTARAVWGTLTRMDEVSGGVELDLNLDYFDGSYPLLGIDAIDARGNGKGTLFAEDCADLGETPLMP